MPLHHADALGVAGASQECGHQLADLQGGENVQRRSPADGSSTSWWMWMDDPMDMDLPILVEGMVDGVGWRIIST